LSTAAGMTRAVWDLRYPPPPALSREYPVAAIAGQTVPEPQGPLATPGSYEVLLSAGGQTYRQPLTIVADPRVHVTPAEFEAQRDLSLHIVAAMTSSYEDHEAAADLRRQLADRTRALSDNADSKTAADAARAFDRR